MDLTRNDSAGGGPREASLTEIRNYFGMDGASMRKEWSGYKGADGETVGGLSEAEKLFFKIGVARVLDEVPA